MGYVMGVIYPALIAAAVLALVIAQRKWQGRELGQPKGEANA